MTAVCNEVALRMRALCSEASRLLATGGDPARASALADEAHALLPALDPAADACLDLYPQMTNLFLKLRDDARCEQLALLQLERESRVHPPRPIAIGCHHLFYAKFLSDRGRHAEAVHHAERGLAWYERGFAPDHSELHFTRRFVAALIRTARAHPPS
jgi:hypothetical protein